MNRLFVGTSFSGMCLILSACGSSGSQPPATVIVTQTATVAPAPAPTVTVTQAPPTPTTKPAPSTASEPTSQKPEPPTDAKVGKSQEIGPLTVTLEEWGGTPSSGGTLLIELWFRVANNDNHPVGPFCGQGAVVIDDQGREHGGDSVLEDYTMNCRDDINPGLEAYPYVIRFILPDDVKPASTIVWAESDFKPFAATWRLN